MLINSIVKFISKFILNKKKKDEFLQTNILHYTSDDVMEKIKHQNKEWEKSYLYLSEKVELLLKISESKHRESEISKDSFCKMADIFVRESLQNKNNLNLLKKIELAFENNKFSTHSEHTINRFESDMIIRGMEEIDKRFPQKKLILTDMPHYFINYEIINSDQIKHNVNLGYAFIIAYNKDYDALIAIEELINLGEKYISLPQAAPMARYFHIDRDADLALKEEFNSNPRLHYCPVDFENIFQALSSTMDLEGDYVEIGVFQGASARAAMNYMRRKKISRNAWFFDTYEGFSYNEAFSSSDAYWQNTHKETSEKIVEDYLYGYENFNVIKNNIITDEIPDVIQKIVVCNIDVDIYDAVESALEKIKNLMVRHGIIIIEDYGHTPMLIGAQKAANDFLKKYEFMFTPIYLPSGQLFLIKR